MAAGNASLSFGSLSLRLGRGHVLGAREPCIMALGDGADMGNPEAVIASVASMLMDGDKARINRYGNQEIRIPLEISGEDLNVVAAGEALVMAEVNRGRNTITWTPPGPIGPAEPNVHDVVYSRLEFHFDDLSENRAIRKFTLILECAPFARRAEPTVVVAEPVPNVPAVWTTINDCTSTAGWSRSDHPAGNPVTVSGGAIRTPNWYGEPPSTSALALVGLSMPFAVGEYLVIDDEPAPLEPMPTFVARVAGGSLVTLKVAAREQVSEYRTKHYLTMPVGTLTDLRIVMPSALDALGPNHLVHDVSKVSRLPHLGTRSQRSFVAEIGGTARTQADIVLETTSGTTMGRELMVYTAPSGKAMQPPLRKWKTVGGTDNPDVTAMSGYSTPLNVQVGISFPVPQPGMHLLLGRLRATSGAPTVTLNWSASNAIRSYGGALDSGAIDITLSTTWRLVPLAVLMLPTTAVPQGSTTIQEMNVSTPSSGVLWDDFYVCNLDVGDLTIFTDMLAGTALPTRAVIRSATLDSPRPAWLLGTRGTAADDVDVSGRMLSAGVHEVEPGPMDIFVMSADGDVGVTIKAYERFMHHVTKRSAA